MRENELTPELGEKMKAHQSNWCLVIHRGITEVLCISNEDGCRNSRL